MKVIRAKTAGFCFGVDRAVKLTYDLLAEGRRVATLGPLIHNPQVVQDLEARGALTCDRVEDVPDGYEVIIRSHGVPQNVYDKISTRGLAYHDATCPFVAKIHKLAAEAGKKGALLLVAGMRITPKCRELWAMRQDPCGFLPIWRSCKICCPSFCNKNPFTWWRRPPSVSKVGKAAKLF